MPLPSRRGLLAASTYADLLRVQGYLLDRKPDLAESELRLIMARLIRETWDGYTEEERLKALGAGVEPAPRCPSTQ